MKPYYKIMDFSENSGVKTLFHANEGSKVIPTKEWVSASKHELVSDGSNNTKYMSGWHDGVEQHMHDPRSCHPIKREAWLTHAQYWEEE